MASAYPTPPLDDGGTAAADLSAVSTVRDTRLDALVLDYDVSVRLRNCITGAARAGRLPFATIGDYIDAGAHAQAVMLRDVRSFGRKTGRELEALVWSVFEAGGGSAEDVGEPPIVQTRRAYLALFESDVVGDLIAHEMLSVRLNNVLIRPRFAELTMAEVIDRFDQTCAAMLREPNCGRKSTREFREFCTDYMRMRLAEAGQADHESVIDALLNGSPLPPPATEPFVRHANNPIAQVIVEPFCLPPHETLAERLDFLLDELEPRERDILRQRNGIGLNERRTLEEVGVNYGVTRERIRQVESKALKRLKLRVRRAPVRDLLLADAQSGWDLLTGGEPGLRHADLYDVRRSRDGYSRLACEIEELSLENWVDLIAHRLPYGWAGPQIDPAQVHDAATLLAGLGEVPLPYPVPALASAHAPQLVALAAELILGRRLCEGYLMPERVGARLRRLVRLHALLAGTKCVLTLETLVAQYRASFSDDPCTERDAEIVMDAAPHLFLEIEEGRWASIGAAGRAIACSAGAAGRAAPRAEEEGTIAYALQGVLRDQGPTRLIDLLDNAMDFMPEGRSVNSIGPILLTRRELFVRALPGVYALPEQIERYASPLPEHWPILHNDTQARLYALARYAGEAREIFPFWSAELEYSLCRWARHSGGPGILPSLLFIAQIDDWPIDEAAREEWSRLRRAQGRYELGSNLRHWAAYERPDFDRVFAACRYAASSGSLSWCAANRLTGRKLDSHAGAGLVALLLCLGAIEEQAGEGFRWQRLHRATPVAEQWSQRFEALFAGSAESPDWESALGQALIDQALRGAQGGSGWVDPIAFPAMFDHQMISDHAPIDDEEDALEQIFAQQRRAREAERRGATLDWLLGE